MNDDKAPVIMNDGTGKVGWLDARLDPPHIISHIIGVTGLLAVPTYYLITSWSSIIADIIAWPHWNVIYSILIVTVTFIMMFIGIVSLFQFTRIRMTRRRMILLTINDALIPLFTIAITHLPRMSADDSVWIVSPVFAVFIIGFILLVLAYLSDKDKESRSDGNSESEQSNV